MPITNTQEPLNIRSISSKVITPSILEGSFGVSSIFGQGSAKELIRFAPTNITPPSISGDIRIPNTLTCNVGSWNSSPSPNFTYQWYADGVPIADETNRTWVSSAAFTDQVITCEVTASNVLGTVTLMSSNSITVQIIEPVNIAEFDVYTVTGLGIQNTIANAHFRFGVISGMQIVNTAQVNFADLYVIEDEGV